MRRWALAVLAALTVQAYAGGFEEAATAVERAARAGSAELSRLKACPGKQGVSREWVEHEGKVPVPRLAGHLADLPSWTAPMLLPVHGVSSWVGVSLRGGGTGVSFLEGSVAFYFNGPEDAPELDFVKTIASGDERELGSRLVELRWFDSLDCRKHRWFNSALARRLGWFTTDDGRKDESYRPIPLPDSINSLF